MIQCRFQFKAILSVALMIISCGKESVEPANNQITEDIPSVIDYPAPEQGALNSFINGNLWVSDEATAATSYSSIVISGVTKEKDIIVIKVEASKAGEYYLDDSQENMLGYISSSNSYFTSKKEKARGSLKISELNSSENWISGTFNAVVYTETNDSLQLSGTFEHLELTSFVKTLSLGNSMSSDINNSPWEAIYVYHDYIAPDVFTIISNSVDLIETKFFIPFDIEPGIYNLNNTVGSAALCINGGCSNASDASITIKSINRMVNKIEAEFSFTHDHNGTISEVTNGSFYLHYWYENGLRP